MWRNRRTFLLGGMLASAELGDCLQAGGASRRDFGLSTLATKTRLFLVGRLVFGGWEVDVCHVCLVVMFGDAARMMLMRVRVRGSRLFRACPFAASGTRFLRVLL
jgi:hypothetical protein